MCWAASNSVRSGSNSVPVTVPLTDARLSDIGRVVCSHRFFLLPGVRVKGLASQTLRLATARAADNWTAAYGERPLLAQSFTGPQISGLSCRDAGLQQSSPACPPLRQTPEDEEFRPAAAPRGRPAET